MRLQADEPQTDRNYPLTNSRPLEPPHHGPHISNTAIMDYYDQDLSNQNMNNIRLYLVRCIGHFTTKLGQLERMHEQ